MNEELLPTRFNIDELKNAEISVEPDPNNPRDLSLPILELKRLVDGLIGTHGEELVIRDVSSHISHSKDDKNSLTLYYKINRPVTDTEYSEFCKQWLEAREMKRRQGKKTFDSLREEFGFE